MVHRNGLNFQGRVILSIFFILMISLVYIHNPFSGYKTSDEVSIGYVVRPEYAKECAQYHVDKFNSKNSIEAEFEFIGKYQSHGFMGMSFKCMGEEKFRTQERDVLDWESKEPIIEYFGTISSFLKGLSFLFFLALVPYLAFSVGNEAKTDKQA